MVHKRQQHPMICLIVWVATSCQATGKSGLFTGTEGTESKKAVETAIADALSEYTYTLVQREGAHA